MPSHKFCPKCGTKLDGDQKFCSSCGNQISAEKRFSLKPILDIFRKYNRDKTKRKIKKTILAVLILIPLIAMIVSLVLVYEKHNRIAILEGEISAEKHFHEVELAQCNHTIASTTEELIGLKEQYGIALSEKDQIAKQKQAAESQVQYQKSEAQKSRADAEKSKEQLSNCQYYLNLASNLADILKTQKSAYRYAVQYTQDAAANILYENYNSALDELDSAKYWLSYAESYDGQVDAIMNKFGY